MDPNDRDQQLVRNCKSPGQFRYESVELSRGKYGIVYVGYLQGCKVAVKKIRVEFGKAQNEAAMLKIEHPNIVKLLHVEDESSFRCFALELCAGTLQQFCDRTYLGPMPGQLDAMIQMSSGLCHIHSKHLVHGDIKPENILISFPDSSSRVVLKISEFGLCKIAPNLHYISPELQDCSNVEKDFRKISTSSSDTYALGYTFVHFLSRRPYSDNGYWIDGLRSDIPVLDLVHRMTLLKTELRPDMGEVLDELINLKPPTPPKISCRKEWCVKTGWIIACSFHPLEPKLACSTENGEVCLFSGSSPTIPFENWCSLTLKSGTCSCVTTVDWNAKGTKLAAGCGDGTVVVWDEDGEEYFRVRLHKKRINSLSWNKSDTIVSHLFVTGSDDNVALIWNATNGSTNYYKGHATGIRQVVWISKNQFASLDDKTINIWQLDQLEPITTFRHKVSIRWIRWIPECQRLASCCVNGSLTNYPLGMKVLTRELPFPKEPVACFDLRSNLLMACGRWDSKVSVWDLEWSDVPRILTGHTGYILAVVFSPDGKYLATADIAKLVCVWSTLTWQILFQVRVPNIDWNCLTWDSSSRKLAVTNQSPDVWVVELEYQEKSEIPEHVERPSC